MSDQIGDLTHDELLNYAAEDVMRRLLTGDFKSIKNLVYTTVDISIRWGVETERRRNAAKDKQTS